MAYPKVFVSSTCFDLGEIRDQLRRFIESYGFEAVLSENGDVFYHPDLHTHESCIHEVSNCQLFVLIVGGRFGGEYIADRKKSITNAEYMAAKENGIPIFTFVRDEVLSNHHIYIQNRKKEFAPNIEYPAIEKQEYATDIFRFVDEVRKSSTNNALEGFKNFQNIESHLRKQWAGMFFDYLKERSVKVQMDATNHLIAGISSSSLKLEELVKSLYRSSLGQEADSKIEEIETYSLTERFFDDALFPSWADNEYYPIDPEKVDTEKMSAISPDGLSWHQYLVDIGLFRYGEYPTSDEDDAEWEEGLECAVNTYENSVFVIAIDDKYSKSRLNLFELGVKKSTQDQREKVLRRMLKKYSPVE